MDKERLVKEAENFGKPGDGYIHSEMKNGKNPQLILSGDFLSIMWQVCGIINRIAERTGTTFEETASVTFSMPRVGYKNIKDELKNVPNKVIEGEDWQEEYKKAVTKKANENNMTLAFKIAECEKHNTSLNNQLVDAKKGYEKNLRAKNTEIDKLNKQILKLEHRLKEMESLNMMGGDSK